MKNNFDYRYGVFARIRKGWSKRQIQLYFNKHGYPYKKSMGVDELTEELKKWEK